mgnify:CR=1 FL=1
MTGANALRLLHITDLHLYEDVEGEIYGVNGGLVGLNMRMPRAAL